MSGALKLCWPVRTRAELQLRTYCDRRVPRYAGRQVRMEFEIRGLSAMIVERRVPWRPTSPAEEDRCVVLRGALAEPPYEGRLLGRRESRMVASHGIESKERFGAPPVSPKAVNASEEFLG